MKIYHVETQEDYNALMVELEEKGHRWLSGNTPTFFNYWERSKEDICVIISSKYITFMNIEQSKKQHPNTPIIEYKAKGENMTQEEMKQEEMKQKEMKQKEMKYNIFDWARDVSVAVESFSRGMYEVEPALQDAKSSAENLIENIDDYLESLKPKFKVGDYVTFDGFNKAVAKIDRIDGNELHGLWYTPKEKNIKQVYLLSGGTLVRHATPEEIAEYESALTFHKHGREPFEVRQGDIISYNESDKFIVDYEDIEPEFETFDKEKFIRGDLTFLKTVEEVNEWL